MAFTANAIISNIESRLGQGGSHVWSYYGLSRGTAWCAAEVSYTFAKTGNKSKWYGGKPVFYVPYAQQWMAKHYKTIYDYREGGSLANVRKGDVVIFMWSRGSRDHIGFARATGKASEIYTIEGNTSGGKVAKKTRAKKYIYAVYRPPYKNAPKPTGKYSGTIPKPVLKRGNKGAQVKYLQQFLNWYLKGSGVKLATDSSFGPATESALKQFQTMEKLKADGMYGSKSHAKAKAYKR